MQMVIPKRCLAADDVNAIRSRMNVRGMATTATVE